MVATTIVQPKKGATEMREVILRIIQEYMEEKQ
jgi:hypothetical protein